MLLASFSFVQRSHLSLPRDSVTLDALLCAFVEQVWESGDPKGWALTQNLDCSMLYFRCSAASMVRRAYSQEARTPSQSNTTSHLPFAAALCGAALQSNDMRLCVFLQVGFHAFL